MDKIRKEWKPAVLFAAALSGIIWYFLGLPYLLLIPFFLLGWLLGSVADD